MELKAAVVIPAYNEAETIAAVIAGARSVADVIVVNDCSADATAAVAAEAGAHVVDLAQNKGVDGAIFEGLREAHALGYDIAATIDADGQHDPSDLKALLEPVLSGRYAMCHSHRVQNARWAEWLLRRYGRVVYGLDDVLSGLKAIVLKDVYAPNAHLWKYRALSTAMPWCAVDAGLPVIEMQISVRDRQEGDTPRIGGSFKANMRVLKALGLLIGWDLRSLVTSPLRFFRHRFRRAPGFVPQNAAGSS